MEGKEKHFIHFKTRIQFPKSLPCYMQREHESYEQAPGANLQKANLRVMAWFEECF